MSLRICFVLVVFLLAGCASAEASPGVTLIPTQTSTASITPILTASPVPLTETPVPPTLEPTKVPTVEICSLMEGVSLQDLPDTIVNPFAPPRLGSDDPHQGVDFADIDPTYNIALEGRTVNAVIDGVIAGIINDRFPYGNAVFVETALDFLPAEQLSTIEIPTPAPIQPGHPSLTCPEFLDITSSTAESRSIYLMYAHLKEPVGFTIGDSVTCGMPLGTIGNSGNSINPHVHLEMRVGPSNMRFERMAHYTGSSSPEEMANYCLWRVSNAFQLLDPMDLYDQIK